MSVLLGLEAGTTGAWAVAVNEAGRLISEASSEYLLHTPRPGWTEQNPEDWWRGAKEALAEVAGQVEDEIVGIGLTGQMHGSVFLDSSNEVIRPALLWNDQRTEKQCEKITEAVGEERLIQVAGNPALTGFQAPKVLWLRDEEPENYEKISRYCSPKTTSGSGSPVLTLEELAEKAGVGRNTVWRLEHQGSGRPDTLKKVADVLGVRPVDLLKERR